MFLRDRNRTVRVYLDFGTEAIKERLKYYNLLYDKDFKSLFKALCDKYPGIKFFNVEHYSIITEEIPIIKRIEHHAN
ncbi:hypothetical protein AUJ66_05290 [Candidatus Desantisbacteria bacterium CG1_02_38_46]|uniref:Uncharacterized protein n=3 Tax=unclassified Candidatus Desantisiibacteriota TaxID=3106372 RepID=A0A2H9PD67_9BACT|nr:MAG: hypothetical protein AUJ66_05290 [Candidatus Desantisbacteria bacterium CG1_02_38_46]PIU51766.1 MAG: hypothetical protein COS91_02790 [Candidatus Desantisbacteria bacterium CG07_land_8_20_14_0_80_39_15]PIZ17346.1 MAG: hypothetical protein COY51_00485 [Candidatus Desantisbacteria bacterium CG_4_10_14_0_8_um_filter_39_17]